MHTNHLRGLWTLLSDPSRAGWGLRCYISNKLPMWCWYCRLRTTLWVAKAREGKSLLPSTQFTLAHKCLKSYFSPSTSPPVSQPPRPTNSSAVSQLRTESVDKWMTEWWCPLWKTLYFFPLYSKASFQVKLSKIQPCYVPLETGSSEGQVKT